jgi:hypothetical protein
MLERQTYAKTVAISTVNTVKSRDSNFIAFYLCPPMVTSRVGKKRNTTSGSLAAELNLKLIVAVQNLVINDPLVKKTISAMAPRRRCPTCGSKQWHKEPSSGLIACGEGHILQVSITQITSPDIKSTNLTNWHFLELP